MAKINYNDIPDINTSWENYAGSSVEKFIKEELKNRCGYLYRSRTKEGDYYYLYGFTDYEQYEAWVNGDSSITPLFKVQLPNIENDTFSVNLTTNSDTQKLVNLGDGVKVNLRYTSTATNPTSGAISDTYNDGTLIISRSANGSAFQEVGRVVISPTPWDNPEFKEYDITSYLVDGDNKIRMRVEDNVNGSISSNITFQSIINTTLKIENATPTSQPLTALQLQYYIQGQVAKTLHIKITQNGVSNTFDYPIGNGTYIEVPYTTPLMSMALESGTIDVDAWLSVDGTELVSYHEKNQFYYSDGSESGTIIILNNVSQNIVNYTNAHLFDLSLYNQNADVDIYIRSTDAETEFLHLTLNDCQVGTVYPVYATLEIESASDNFQGVVSVNSANFNCEPYIVSIDNTEKMSPTVGADFVLNPKVRNNSETNPARIINSVNGYTVLSTFTGFEFINDGWVSDESGIQVLRVPAEHKLTINYDALNNLTNGTTFEIDFKTFNMFDDSDVIFKISSETADNKPLGFIMNPTECAFYTAENQTKRDQDVIFQEGERTHLAVNIIPNLANSGLNYIRFFINGVMNREILYTSSDIFKNGTLNIEIGSNNTDIDIYGIRVYKKGLSASDVRQDYMSSIPTIEEKIAYKASNDILSSNGTISYDKAKVKYNTLVWTGKFPSYSTGNKEYEGKLNINIIGDNVHSGDITNLRIKGQGSSSRGYWKWNHQYDMDKLANPSVFTNLNGDTFSGYALTDNDPEAKKLVAKLNWASSMQSHKIGSTALYTDLWREIVGGNSITATQGYENVRVSVHEKPFLYFVKDNDSSQPVFYGLMTFGSAKYDKPTFGYDKKVFPDYLILEGSDNGMPLTLRQVPWVDGEVVYNAGEEYYEYAGQGNLDYGMGNQDMIHYFKDAFNFSYLHSPRLRAYTQDSELTDASYQYWNTSTKNVKRYDWISNSWVDASIINTTPCEYHSATQEDVDNHLANKVGEKVVDVLPVYETLNLETQTGLLRANFSSDADYTTAVINWRVNDFKSKISIYYNVNDVLYSMVILKLIAASDNWCKNTYEYLDPVSHKICLAQDDMDTLFLTDNVGRKTKPYYVEEHDIDGENKPYFNGDTNNFFCLMEKAFESEEKNMMRQVFNTMRSKFETPVNCIQNYFFNVQEYFPAVAYNETARLLYEEAAVAEAQGRYDNATPPITQSLGNQLEAEKQWWKRRIPYLQSWSSADPFYVRSTVEPNVMFRSMTTVAGENPTYQFTLTPWQWLYPKAGTGQYLSTDTQRVPALTQYTTVLLATDGNTDTYIYGSDYYTSLGEFGGVSLSEAFRLNGKRLLEFSADSRNVSSYEFRPRSMTVNCPALRRLSLYGCSTLGGSLDLSGCLKLEYVDLRGTGLNTVILPETEKLTTVYLPDLTSITVINCPNISTFSVEGYTNLLSLTTDNSSLADDVISNVDTLTSVDLRKIHITTTSENVDKYINILTDENISCSITGSVYLAKSLSNTEIAAIENRFGESVWSENNPLYITYIPTEITTVSLAASENTIFQNDSVVISVSTDGNNVKSYDWSVNSTISLTTVEKKNSLTINSTTFDKIENITITYTIITTSNQTLTSSITISCCHLDIHIQDFSDSEHTVVRNDYSLRNAVIDLYADDISTSMGRFDFTGIIDDLYVGTNYQFDGNPFSGGYSGEYYFILYEYSVAQYKVYWRFPLHDSNKNEVYVYVPFYINCLGSPEGATYDAVSDLTCYNGVGSTHISYTIPAGSTISSSSGVLGIPRGKYTISNQTNTGFDLSINGITQSYSNVQAYVSLDYPQLFGESTVGVYSYSNQFAVNYVQLGAYAKIKYNITETGDNNVLMATSSADIGNVKSMTVDGVEITPTKTYNFTTTGTHNIEVRCAAGYDLRYLLYNINSATEVEFGDATTLGQQICYGCSSLQKVIIKGTINSIGSGAFNSCSSLTQIYITETTKCPTVVSDTFRYIRMGGTVYFPDNVDFSSWFSDSAYYLGYYDWNVYYLVIDGIRYKLNTGTKDCVVMQYTSDGKYSSSYPSIYTGDIVIPSSITYNNKSYTVNKIGIYCFNLCSGLTSVSIPNTITTIEYRAFHRCTGLTSINIPASVINIAGNTYNVSNSDFGEVFFGCSNSLTSIVVAQDNPVFSDDNGSNCLIHKFNNYLVLGCKNTVIPSSVLGINNNAFYGCTGLTSIEISSSVNYIGRFAFAGCENLSTIIINRSTAPTVYTPTSSDTYSATSSWGDVPSNATGSNNRGTGNNVLYVPSDATGYDTTGWTNCLLRSTYSDFTLSKTL